MSAIKLSTVSFSGLRGGGVLRIARRHIGNFFALLLLAVFAAAGFVFWKYIWQPIQNPPIPTLSRVASPGSEKLEKLVQDIELRASDYKKSLSAPSRNPFIRR